MAIRRLRISSGPIRRAGRWGYLDGSLREGTPNFIDILINIGENYTKMFKRCLSHQYEIHGRSELQLKKPICKLT